MGTRGNRRLDGGFLRQQIILRPCAPVLGKTVALHAHMSELGLDHRLTVIFEVPFDEPGGQHQRGDAEGNCGERERRPATVPHDVFACEGKLVKEYRHGTGLPNGRTNIARWTAPPLLAGRRFRAA